MSKTCRAPGDTVVSAVSPSRGGEVVSPPTPSTYSLPPARPATRSLAVPFLVLGAADLAAKALGFLATLAVIRHYGPEGFGQVSFAQALLGFALIGTACGLDVSGVRWAS